MKRRKSGSLKGRRKARGKPKTKKTVYLEMVFKVKKRNKPRAKHPVVSLTQVSPAEEVGPEVEFI